MFLARDEIPEHEQEKRDAKNDAEVLDEQFRMTHLWVHDIETEETARLTDGAFSVSNPDWSPDSRRIAYERRPDPSANAR